MAETSQYVKEATDSDFDQIIKGNHIVLVDCWAPWCGPCRILAPTIEALAKDYGDKVAFYKLNTDENPRVSNDFRIRSIPTIFIFVDGKLADTIIGAVPRQYIEGKLKPLLS
ncbi:thioredoxin [Methanocella sp. CWC-04]|uniref:Thioredoxin n=1 Tax=Methanooceanicella nereidis TaxID=2052831 RepID=A0AAP2RDX1_9EURY|nr:thioredoxin [Methanocella sp. CWC-04]MCD1295342.1 thioredoxin [Methanocella sp. CWC-04]